MIKVGDVMAIIDRASQALDQADLLIRAAQQQCAKIRGQRAAVKVRAHRKAGDSRKTKLARERITHGRSRLRFVRSVIGVKPIISITTS